MTSNHRISSSFQRVVRLMPLAAAAIFFKASGCLAAGSLTITSPTPGQAVKGPVTFTVAAAGLATLASVEYEVDVRPLSGPIAVPPYSFAWNSAERWDGPATVRAVARDQSGNVLVESPVVTFQVDNGLGSIRLVSPDASQTLHGKVHFEVYTNRVESPAEIAWKKAHGSPVGKLTEAIMLFVDGKQVAQISGSQSGSADVDTTGFSNGRHVFYASAWAFAEGVPPFAMLRTPVMIDNGHAVRDVRPRWQTLYLAPGGKTSLAPHTLYTDATEGPAPAGIVYKSTDPTIAAVDAAGMITAGKPGATLITLTSGGHTATTQVVVDEPHGMPHFSRDGHILTEYDPDRSWFVRSLFFMAPSELDGKPELVKRAHEAAINTLTTGFYQNPADNHQPSFEAWSKGWDPWFASFVKTAKDDNFGLLLTGDDIARTTGEMHDSISNPWAPQAIQLAFTRARDSKAVVAIDMVDETSFLWGPTPTPTGGAWMTRTPPIPDDAFVTLMKTVNAVPDRPPVSWPVGGLSGPGPAHNWMGDPHFADYSSLYWTYWDWRIAYPWGSSLPQDREGLDRNVVDWRGVLQRDKPQLLLTSLSGPFYTKKGPGDQYTPGQDSVQAMGPSPQQVALEPMYAIAEGMSGVRAYGFDYSGWKAQRRDAKIGDGGLQTGADPFEVGTDRWNAMSNAFNLIRRLEPQILQPMASAEDLGAGIVTGARRGPRGRMLIAASFTEAPEKKRVDLTPYRYEGGSRTPVIRYRINGGTLSTQVIPNTAVDDVTLAPGETLIWVFPQPVKTNDAWPSIRLDQPLAISTITGPVTVRADVTASKNLASVEFFADGQSIGRVTHAPYTITWDTTTVKAGIWHGLSAVATTKYGLSSEARAMVKVVAGQ